MTAIIMEMEHRIDGLERRQHVLSTGKGGRAGGSYIGEGN